MGEPKPVQRVEQFEDAGFQYEPSLRDHPEMPYPCRLEIVNGETLTEMREEQQPAFRPGQTQRPVEEIGGHIEVPLGSSEVKSFLVKPLGVEQ